MTEDIAIKVDNVSKDFLLPHEKVGSLKNAFVNMLKGGSAKSVEKQHALSNIDFEIKRGEFFGIVGRNGSGKSTLLKIIAGIYQPTSGSVSYSGRLVPFIELGVGFNPELTGRENVYLNGALMGFSRKEIAAKYSEIVNFAELERFMDQKLKNYSSGMQVRLAFSVATILAESDILLIDEVLAVGDADFQRKCFKYFKELKKKKKTVIFVTHDMNAVREYCDRAVMIEQSELVASGTPDSVAEAYIKMFAQENSSETTNLDKENRWGNGKITYEAPVLSSKKLTNEPSIAVSIKLKAAESVDDPVLGFSVKNAAGVNIFGTNTHIKKSDIKHLDKNDVIELTWVLPNIFSDGSYSIGLAAVNIDGVETYDWWDDAGEFKVVKEEMTPYIVGPDIQLKVKKIKS